MIAFVGLLDDPSLPAGELGGVDAGLDGEAALLPLVEDVEDDEDSRLVVSSTVDGFFAGDRDSFSSATPFSSGKVSGREDSGTSLPSPLSLTETDGVMSSPGFDFSLPLSLSRMVDAFSLPFWFIHFLSNEMRDE